MKDMYHCTKYAAWVGFTFLSHILGARFIKLPFDTGITQFCLGNSYDSATDCAAAYIDQGWFQRIWVMCLYIVVIGAILEPEPELLNELECRSFCHSKLKTVEIEVETHLC
ncbi:hypothetical protein Lal_00030925 [Lupinus albus]|nr:hypothetical protein Lal_00030925 [Lupinus albus]